MKVMKSARWALLGMLALTALTACSQIPGFAQIQAVTVMGTDKTMEDHIVSYTSGKDCSSIRKEQGLTYCVEDMPLVRQNLYCYRDLGGVTCYDRPSPHGGDRARVDQNEHNLPK